MTTHPRAYIKIDKKKGGFPKSSNLFHDSLSEFIYLVAGMSILEWVEICIWFIYYYFLLLFLIQKCFSLNEWD